MKLGLSMRVTQAVKYDEARDSISHDWLARLRGWEITPVLIPNILADVPVYLETAGVDCLVLTGGDDLGATKQRDETETRLLEHAMLRSLPVLGVCRGLQLINDFCGGRSVAVTGHVATAHTVKFSESWAGFYGDQTSVNSYHNLGIEPAGVGASLAIAATDSEGFVEAVEHRDLPLAAIMWHPERTAAPDGDRALLRHLTGQ
ncbi:MAG: C26 family cysteine hydrolase domain-containing family [Rhodospirillaceae bacterium]|jgi:N5-(cytidine 5'-diphosphoramidyl)-L-glutamine hydrolase|nr:C26 family cysteine hydrolase domain-containing family [Rhodospirillaceae bacterium]MBT5459369.1 C26 family cysteine hydrolase domain-containing family [Rhodospirillaceae bacterium]MBT7760209.1 C26 family cysteine hydrolase domain-containing family [Rhodospirillaceae bacterium]